MKSTLRSHALLFVTGAMMVAGCGRDDDRPPTFTYVYETILAPSCATIGCHNSFTQTAALQFNTKVGAYSSLTGTACDDEDQQEPRNFVMAGRPDSSQLIHLLRGDDAARRMPPDRGLSSVDIALIEDWILEGARCD